MKVRKKKYFGQQYWSLRAINQTIITGVVKELRHEHVIPKNLLKELLLIDGGFEWVAYQAKSAVIARDEARELDRHYKNTVPEGEIWNGEIDPEFADIQRIWHLLFPEEQNVVGCPRRPFCRYIELRDIHHFTIRLFDLSSLEISNSQIFFDLFADCGNEEDILNRLTNIGCVEAF